MVNSIRTKLTATYVILMLAVMVLTSFFLHSLLEQYYIDHQYETVSRAAMPISELAGSYLRTTPDVVTISNLAEGFAQQINARVLITDHRQRVLGDSLRVGGMVGSTLEREEIEAALEGEEGRSVQFSQQSQQWVMQVAVPIYSEENIVGTVFISTSLAFIYQVLGDISRLLQIATVLSLLFAALIGIYLAQRLTRPIEALTGATEQMARGDLSQRVPVRSKDEIGRLAKQFNNMAERLQEMTRQLREFVANASHEMRTPLTSLNILVKSMREYPLEEEEREEFLEDIDQELERMIRLVESLLDLTRLDRLAAEDTVAMADLVPTVVNTLEMLQKKALEKEISLDYTVPEETAPVFAVLHQIKQVVFNLVDNAIKYTPAGGQVHVSLKQDPNWLVLTVADTGIGIPAEHREKVFERFYRVDKARSREAGGTGLGLSIVYEIVQRHGGQIFVEDNDDGIGSRFVVKLPLIPDAEAAQSVNKN
ncbi:sensor histidine kinase [Dethiobacter alkaliphilus]|uniref:sensor histidine kinase n=1 Tax=Dethiobacter alkaliphilus TaxID=427926 RepID=UPI0022278E2C|nr:cell wall metabolism sensor histidine kinase WalK [Dethiobacter alkaliphilus]MCW3489002.1 cell wall metabolism sensor histidine kinase WalK [Dethiobacter alkaliphilus]